MIGKLLALDVGLVRIGVATCDPLGLAARPLTVIRRASRRADFDLLAQLVRQQEAVAVVCGLPVTIAGGETDHTASIRKWALRLAQALRTLLGRPIPIIFWDERLSTFAAQEILSAQGNAGAEDDAVAAAVILQSYLDAGRSSKQQDYGRIELPPRSMPNQSLSS
ncbi:MAG: Holliday junction resolvase RuvX [Chloroflexota bacterium]|nr:Holliday junction resolvase RuvX [Chloroflexota bacterium]